MKPIANVAFVGCGSHSTHNLYPMLRYANCRLQAVCDLDEAAARRNARAFGAEAWYTDTRRMLDQCDLDGVFVVGPAEVHQSVGREVLARGLALFVEKPPAPDLNGTRELVELARAHDTFFMTGFMKRHGMTYGKVRGMIGDGSFNPAQAFIRYGHWRLEDLRAMLFTMASHPVDLALALLGNPVQVASHRVAGLPGISLAVTLRFERGTVAQLMLDAYQPRVQERLEVSGTLEDRNAFIVVDNIDHLTVHRQGCSGVDLTAPDAASIDPVFDLEDIRMWRPDYGIPNMGQTRHFIQGFAGEVRCFVDAARGAREPDPTMEESLRVVEVLEAIAARPDGVTDL